MGQRIFGQETEYALAALSRNGRRLESAPRSLMALARVRLPHLLDAHHGIFLQNGGKLYLDAGDHPEFSSPECTNPWDICRYQRAIESILGELAAALPDHDRRIKQVLIGRCNVSYVSGTTWGCHENYAHTAADLSFVDRQLLPHLASRVIYTGAGGFNNRVPGVVFMVSPRVAHLEQVASDSSQKARGILHHKMEPLSRPPWHRCHLLCGDTLLGDTPLWLKIAITSLVIALAEAGIACGDEVQLRDPLRAMRKFASDVSCTARACTKDGRRLTAIEIQRHILARLEAHADHPVMPSWTGEACRRLRTILDRLGRGPAGVATTLDWVAKLAVYQGFTRKHGVPWEDLPHWNRVFSCVERAARRRRDRASLPLLGGRLFGRSGPFWEELTRLAPFLREKGLRREDFEGVVALRQKLFDLDFRFGQLGEDGVFTALERAGLLDHAVAGVDNIEHAKTHPPEVGRARVRGQCVRELHARKGECLCSWSAIWDFGPRRRVLDLSDPLAASAEGWEEFREDEVPFPHLRGGGSRQAAEMLETILARGEMLAGRR